MSEGYTAIAKVYEKLNKQVPYKRYADFIEACFDRFMTEKPSLILDLACGTGKLTRELAKRSYDMTGVDGSAEMLSEAIKKKSMSDILYLQQDLTDFELYGTVDATVCTLDSLNYLLDDGELDKCFHLVHNYLIPNGLFIFDMNSPYKFENVYSDNSYILEDAVGGKEIYCGWQNFYDKKSKLCDFFLTLFNENKDGSYERSEEHQTERCYSLYEVEKALENNHLELIGVYSDFNFNEINNKTERWYFVARAKK